MGYFDIDGRRYMDVRHCDKFYFPIAAVERKASLPSDAQQRTDSNILKTGNVEKAQAEKEKLEELQRKDRRLRENV